MYQIEKNLDRAILNALAEFRRDVNASYDNLPKKIRENIKNALLAEQGFLCAYCMARISFSNMKVEHFNSQAEYRNRELDYDNMLACCKGNENCDSRPQTCDTFKGDKELKYSPAQRSPAIQTLLSYNKQTGEIRASDGEFNGQLNTVLNLNSKMTGLPNYRKAVIDKVRTQLNSVRGRASKAHLKKLKIKLLSKNNQGKYQPYMGVGIDYLDRKL